MSYVKFFFLVALIFTIPNISASSFDATGPRDPLPYFKVSRLFPEMIQVRCVCNVEGIKDISTLMRIRLVFDNRSYDLPIATKAIIIENENKLYGPFFLCNVGERLLTVRPGLNDQSIIIQQNKIDFEVAMYAKQ